jgi:hypothetical protein
LKKIDFEKQQALAADPNFSDAGIMPKMADTLAQMTAVFGQIGESLAAQTQIQGETLGAQREILHALQKPKAVSLGQLRKNSAGQITGASVTVQ